MNFKNLKISKRLLLGYIVILGFSLATSIVAIIEINHIWGDTKNLYEKPFKASNLLRDIKINALNIRRYMLDMTILNDKKELVELEKLINQQEANAIQNFKEVISIYQFDRVSIEESYLFFKNWKGLRDEVIELTIQGNASEASNIVVTKNREYVSNLFNLMQTVINSTSQKADALYKSANKTKVGIIKLLLITLILTLGVSVMLAYLITRSIAAPLSNVVKNIRAIARGNLSNDKLPESDDEIGQLAFSFNLMQEDLLEKAMIAERIAKGDFAARVNPSSSDDIVAESINMIAVNFDLVVKQAQKVAEGNFKAEISGITSTNPLSVAITHMLESLKEVVVNAKKVAKGDFSGHIVPKSNYDELALSLNQMTLALKSATDLNLKQTKLKTAQNELNELVRGELSTETMANNIITYLAKYTNAQIGAIYIFDEEQSGYMLSGSYAYNYGEGLNTFFRDGESLVGQAALQKELISLSDLPDNYLKITSGIGDSVPRNLIIAPFIHEGKTIGVIELGAVNSFNEEAYEFLNLVMENIAISVLSAINRVKMTKLLDITKAQAEELQVQQEELRQTNEELEEQTQALKKSEEFLQSQQEELRVTNEELEQKTVKLEEHKVQMERQNQDLEEARVSVELKAKELEITNKYKSEFLANMSHELRTPLNSLLILAQNLMENKEKNLIGDQVEAAEIIYNSGNDLLNLINDILHLSKIESGKMNVIVKPLNISKIEKSLRDYFEHIIKEKGLEFKIITSNLPQKITTDNQRLNQILRNLMSNAIKFTEKGSITVNMFKPEPDENLSNSGLSYENTIAISVKDTGIGIPKEKQVEIFEAFQQADGSTSRKYGGTGLGLSITRKLAKLLGGEVKLISEPGKGSEFTLFLPLEFKNWIKETEPEITHKLAVAQLTKNGDSQITSGNIVAEKVETYPKVTSIPDDRFDVKCGDKCILIIEDDLKFAKLLSQICKEKDFNFISTASGEEGIGLAYRYLPKGILLDIKLPGIDGWQVLERLKNNPETRHIPVHIISVNEETIEGFNKGIYGHLTKPVTKEKLLKSFDELQLFIDRKIKELLIIEDDENLRKNVKNLLSAKDVIITECSTGKKAYDLISSQKFDCIVLDLGLPDMTGFDLLKSLNDNEIKIPPIIVYTGREITPEENSELQKYTQNIIIKGVKSEERLLDETALFLHRVVDEMPEKQKKMLINLYDKDEMFRGKTILIVDDDMRNIFALTKVLEASNMKVLMAQNGKKALEMLNKSRNVDLILMDIMMPVMDGYEAMHAIRNDKLFEKLPIIALTAKAMKDDRTKAIAAGASDYLVKPVDIQKLFNIMHIWLYQ